MEMKHSVRKNMEGWENCSSGCFQCIEMCPSHTLFSTVEFSGLPCSKFLFSSFTLKSQSSLMVKMLSSSVPQVENSETDSVKTIQRPPVGLRASCLQWWPFQEHTPVMTVFFVFPSFQPLTLVLWDHFQNKPLVYKPSFKALPSGDSLGEHRGTINLWFCVT